jgi:signal transduction histidine kinase
MCRSYPPEGGFRLLFPPLPSVSVGTAPVWARSARWGRSELTPALTAAATLAVSLIVLQHGGIPFASLKQGELNATSGVLAACSTLPVLGWRRSPVGVLLVTTAATAILIGLGYRVGLPIGPAAAIYLLAANRDSQRPSRHRETVTVLACFGVLVAASGVGDGTFLESDLLHSGLAWAVAWFAGERTRLRREHIAELEERARRAERDAERDRRLAVAEERARIARDLHDSAGHAINVIAVQASAGRLRYEQDPERARAALAAIEEVARQTADEVDQIVRSLREQDPAAQDPIAPAGIASIGTLVAHHVAAGLAVTVHQPTEKPHPLAHAVDQAAYRIIQEALTNAARHGTGRAYVDLAFAGDGLELTVSNPVRPGSQTRKPGGHGLIGMRERAALLGGTLDADRLDGTFRVRARLPYLPHGAVR